MRPINHWIDGRTVEREPERSGAVYDPAELRELACEPQAAAHHEQEGGVRQGVDDA